MGDFRIEADVGVGASGVGPDHPAEEMFGEGVAGAEDDDLHDHVAQGLGEGAAQQVEAFLGGEAGDDAEDRDLGVDP